MNLKQKRYAVCSALAASAVPSLLMARGHHVESVPEVPLVLDDSSEARRALQDGRGEAPAGDRTLYRGRREVSRRPAAFESRYGVHPHRLLRDVQRKGPLAVYARWTSFRGRARNINGAVELCSVDRLGLLTLAPGGHVGRFIIWTKSAFEKLDSIYGTSAVVCRQEALEARARTNIMAMPDLSRVINSDEIQSAINPPKEGKTRAHAPLKRNPLKNKSAMDRLNPYAKVAAEMRAKAEAASSAAKAKKTAGARFQGWPGVLRGHEEGVQLRGRALRRFRHLAQGQALRGGGGVSCHREQRIVAIVEYQLQQFVTKTTQTTSGGLRRDASRRTHCVILSYTALALHWYDDSASTQSTQCPSDA